ncbi:phytosulfokine receptor 2-like [Andrographis paniculata]|uniref:phytosulfokine receptor 2-like n=1 Tax=Andrographis paniculata TaxID=175694 RepID=UPI0021E860C0|nr:phytosulfokine receptor 2-like [Andrographis paniculata]XP_051125325.1 phytosulfokine receptor 2-like [Andrographis paniculata]XP_051125326.1 phytosulfokine receptor 2-like [Andrographis paniculata]
MIASDFPLMNLLNSGFLAFIFVSLVAASQTCHPNDLSALKDFAGQLTNGSVKFQWLNESNCCGWEGVVCGNGVDKSGLGRVIELSLSGKGLKGVVSASISNLDNLKSLDLSYNSLEGEIPSKFSNLKQLEVLDFSHNVLVGTAFGSIAGLESIQSLNLSGNSFNGSLNDFGIFPNLFALNLSNNFFNGQLNTRNCSFSSKIRVLDLSRNHFTGGIQGFDACSRLIQQLHLDFNSFSGEIPDSLYLLSSLELLSISVNNFSGELSEKIGNLSNLKVLVLSGNRFSGSLPNVFGNLTHLELFIAYSNSFDGLLPSTLSLCSKLRVLDLRNNSLSGRIDLDFSGLSNLCTLDLGTNRFIGSLPESLSRCQGLEVVSLARNNLSGSIPPSYANLSSLKFLSLSNNSLADLSRSLSVLKNCRNLTTLILTKNFHGEEIPENVSGFESLLLLALGNCGLTGRIPNWLSNCRKLQVLDLSWNRLDGSMPSWIGRMDGLFYLDLSNNSLTGGIPKSVTELRSLSSVNGYASSLNASTGIPIFVKRNQTGTALQYNQASSFPPSIFLNDNRINGSIWPEIGQLRQLHVLDLSRNNISGTIPSSISEMVNLETLDLSDNDLHGSIPSSFNRLTFLSKFSVANNHLEGPIPTGGQFFSFPSSSFEGNPGLCGKLISSCIDKNSDNTSLSHRHGKFGQGSILSITLSVGIAMALIVAVLVIKISRNDVKVPTELSEEEISHGFTDAFGPPKLVLFKNAECRELTVLDLLKSTNNFNQSNIVGCGGFGLVYMADLPNGAKAAIKRLSGDCGQMEREFQAEVEALSRAQHKNLVSLQGYCRCGNDRLLIYSYMENGSLDYWLHERVDASSFLTWDTRLKIARGTAHGLAYLHKEPNIIHRDIKTSNILLDEKFEAHLADFGLSRLLRPYDTHVTTDLVGTLGYIPPEYSQTLTATFRGDIYSFGVVLLELLTGRRPVEVCKGKSCRDLVAWVHQKKFEKSEEEIFDLTLRGKDCYDNNKQLMIVLGIACKCLDRDPRRRPSIDEVVSLLDAVDI